MGRARGQKFWEGLAGEVGRGEAIAHVARRHGVATSALGYWVRRLRDEPKVATTLLPVRVTDASPRRVEVEVEGARLRFADADPEYIAAVVRACRPR